MIEKELFYKIANTNFGVFEIVNEDDVQSIYNLYPDKEQIRQYLSNKIFLSTDSKLTLPQKTSLELYILLAEYCFRNNISLLEACALFRVISDVLELIKENLTQQEVYDKFKSSVLKFSMNRFFYQIGIFQKRTVYLITNFFVDVIYRRYYFLSYALTKKVNIDLDTRELSTYELPKVEDLGGATEILPRNAKILRQYFESKRPKTELEQKIEMVLEFERERLDKKMEKIFEEQDEEFNKKVDELLKKKK
jgi:hypothetical protein